MYEYTSLSNEVIGIMTEKIVCDISQISFNSIRNYSLEYPLEIYQDLHDLNVFQGLDISKHYGNENKYFDFITNTNKSISLKTTFSNSKLCPANIGQATIKTMKKYINIETKEDYKKMIYTDTLSIINMYKFQNF